MNLRFKQPIFILGQRGAALITSLIIVLIVSVLGVAISKQVISLRKSSTAHYDQTLSFANAESGLGEAEAFIVDNVYSAALSTYSTTAFTSDNWWQNGASWASATVVTQGGNAIAGNPTYMIEDMGTTQKLTTSGGGGNNYKRHFFRITAKANGKGDAVSYMQSYYAIIDY